MRLSVAARLLAQLEMGEEEATKKSTGRIGGAASIMNTVRANREARLIPRSSQQKEKVGAHFPDDPSNKASPGTTFEDLISGASSSREQGVLRNKKASANKENRGKPCDPTLDYVADVGILSCGFNFYCVESQDSPLGGFCTSMDDVDQKSRRQQTSFCDELRAEYSAQSCDCSAFNTATGTGTIDCIITEDYCICANLCADATLEAEVTSNTAQIFFCYDFTIGYERKVCYSYSEEQAVTCAIYIDDVACTSCQPTACPSSSFNGTIFNCTNVSGGGQGSSCDGDQILPALSNRIEACQTPTISPAPASPPTNPAPTGSPTAAPTTSPTASPTKTSPPAPNPAPIAIAPIVGVSPPVVSPTDSETASPTSAPTSSPTASPVDPPSPWWKLCFSSNVLVQVKGKGAARMDQLKIGDVVLASGSDGNTFSSMVYSFGHYAPNATTEYLQVYLQSSDETNKKPMPLEITRDHMLYRFDDFELLKKTSLIPAGDIKVGDVLVTAAVGSTFTATSAKVEDVRTVTRVGAFAPFTTSGDIVVTENNIVASNYIALPPAFQEPHWLSLEQQHWLQHVAYTPYRWYCIHYLGNGCQNETYHPDTGLSLAVRAWLPVLGLAEGFALNIHILHLAAAAVFGFYLILKRKAAKKKNKA